MEENDRHGGMTHFPPNFVVIMYVGVLLDGLKASEHPRGHYGAHARSIKLLGYTIFMKMLSCAFECRPFTNRDRKAHTGYMHTYELRSAVRSRFMKGITRS